MKKTRNSFPLFIVKRMNISKRNAWFIRIGGMLVAFLIAGILCNILSPGTFGEFYYSMFRGTFSSSSYVLNLCCCLSTYLLLALAVTPAFKMKFWNIGVEGQTLASCIVTAVILLLVPESVPGPVVIIMALICGVGAGIIWALIPTLFKIKFNTNETLFTLLMNYVATGLAAFTIAKCTRGGSGIFPMISDQSRLLVNIGGVKYIPFIVCAIVFTLVMIFYLSKAKHGFELSVLGVSTNTARYVGISINKVAIRTMVLSGAIAGLVGFLLVCGQHKTLTTTLVGGKGFTAVLIAWLGHFNPSEIALYSFVIGFLDQGTTYAASKVAVNKSYFAGLIIGLFILVVIVAEFFVRYQVKTRESDKVLNTKGRIAVLDDSKTDEAVLRKEFSDIKVSEYAIKLNGFKKKCKIEKKKVNNEIFALEKRIIFGVKINKIDKEKLRSKLLELKQKRLEILNQYKKDKSEYRIKLKCAISIINGNTIRVTRVIRKNVRFCIEQTKKDKIIFASKDKLNDFLNKFVYTNWPFKTGFSIKQIWRLRKEYKFTSHKFKKALKEGKAASNLAMAKDNALFKYLIANSNRAINHYLNANKKHLRFQLKAINMKNKRLKKKQENKIKKEQLRNSKEGGKK